MMKRMKGFGAFALLCALTLAAASPSLAKDRMGPQDRGFRDEGLGIARLVNPRAMKELNLTQAQENQVRELMKELRPAHKKGERDGSVREAMQQVRQGKGLDPAVKVKLTGEIAERIRKGTEIAGRLYTILTPDQRAIVNERLDRIGEGRGKGPRQEGRFGEMGGDRLERLAERLDLTEEQQIRAEALFKAEQRLAEPGRKELLALGKEMGKMSFSANPDKGRLAKDANRAAALAVDGMIERARVMEKFRAILTPEQRDEMRPDKGWHRSH